MRSITLALTLPLLTLPTLPLAEAGELVKLELEAQTGQRAEVSEESRSELQLHYRKAGEASVGGSEVSWSKRSYTEEILRHKPLVQVREYKSSERWQGKPGAKREPRQTSLHGRRVKLSGLEFHPLEAFELSKSDREQLRFDRLCRAFLPTAGQAVPKEKWTLPSEGFARALWGKHVPPGSHHGGASVELRKVRNVGGRQVATLKVKLDFRTELRDSFPEISLKLKGTLRWDLDEQDLLSAKLEGSLGYATVQDQVRAEAKGPFSYAYAARYLIPREVPKEAAASAKPPPPGATALICTHDARHRIALKDIVCCPECGETLNRERKCPKDHAWTLRHCFQDGAPLRHE